MGGTTMGGAGVVISKVLRRLIRTGSRHVRRVAPRYAVDYAFFLDRNAIVIGWHESTDLSVLAGTSRRTLNSLRVLRYNRPDLDQILGPNNLGGFVAMSPSSARPAITAKILVRTRFGTGRPTNDRRPLLDAPYETVRDVAERLVAESALERQSAVRLLVLPALRRRIAAQQASPAATHNPYRASHYPTSCQLNVVVPFYGSFEFAHNILATLSLVREEDIGGTLAVTFVCDDPRIERSLVDFVQSQNESVNRLPLVVCAHATNRGFAAACNTGAAATQSAVTLFLNSDVIASGPDAVNRLAFTLANDPTIAAASPTLLFPDGTLQARELVTFENPLFPGFTLLEPPCKGLQITTTFPETEDADLLPGAMLAVRTATFNEAGGFSLEFGSGDFEDAELCTRLRKLGRLVVIDSTAVHLEGHSYRRNVLEVLARSIVFEDMCAK